MYDNASAVVQIVRIVCTDATFRTTPINLRPNVWLGNDEICIRYLATMCLSSLDVVICRRRGRTAGAIRQGHMRMAYNLANLSYWRRVVIIKIMNSSTFFGLVRYFK